MTDALSKLIDKKKQRGVLSGRDALILWRHVETCIDRESGAGKWTQKDFEQLTRWQFGLPTTVQFQIVAGPAGAQAPTRVGELRGPDWRRPLHRRKYATLAEREIARKAKRAAVMARLRLQKTGK